MPTTSRPLAALAIASIISSQSQADIAFQDVTKTAGLTYTGLSFGSAWGDFNNDGWTDLWNNNHFKAPSLYINNRDGTFTDIAANLDKRRFFFGIFYGDTHGAAWADFDNDGDQDLIEVTGADRGTGSEANHLYRNDSGKFTRVDSSLGVDYSEGRGRVAAWVDYNNDGLLDLFQGNLDRADKQGPSTLFQQTASGFADVGASLGLAPTPLLDFNNIESAKLADLTGDGRLDLVLLSNWNPQKIYVYDMSSTPFSERSAELGISPPPKGLRSVELSDLNGDLLVDMFAVVSGDGSLREEKIFMNDGRKLIDKTAGSGIRPSTACHRVVSGDFDNDGDLDLYVACKDSTKNTPNILYENIGNGLFREVADAGGASGAITGDRDEITVVDYDRDGFLDLFLTNGLDKPGPSQLFHNKGNHNRWIEIDLQGSRSNRDAIGARVFVTAGGVTQLRERNGGTTVSAQSDKRLHFGLKDNVTISHMRIHWPSGIVQNLESVETNKVILVTEPSEVPAPEPTPTAAPTPTPAPAPKPEPKHSTPDPIADSQTLPLIDPRKPIVDIAAKIKVKKKIQHVGRNFVVNLFAINHSSHKAKEMVLLGKLPDGTSVVSLPSSCALNDALVVCRISSLSGKSKVRRKLVVKMQSAGIINFASQVASSNRDSNPNDNLKSVDINVK